VFDIVDRATSDDHVGVTFYDRFYKTRYVRTVILVISVRVNDDICAEFDACVQTCHERLRQTVRLGKSHNVVYRVFLGDLDSSIRASVVNDQRLDLVHALYCARNIAQR
jgi:hypothetical protein